MCRKNDNYNKIRITIAKYRLRTENQGLKRVLRTLAVAEYFSFKKYRYFVQRISYRKGLLL